MMFGKTLGKAIKGLVIIAAPFSIVISQTVQAADVVRSLSLEERVGRLENQQKTRNLAMVDLQYKISDLQQEIRMLLGIQEENNYRLSQLTERQREIYKDIDRRLMQAQKDLKNVSKSSNNRSFSERSNRYNNPPQPVIVKRLTETNTVTNTNARDEAQAYEEIFPLVTGKKYSRAITAYEDFLVQYPDGKYAVNAHYWLGQVHYVQGQLDEASRQFKIVSEFSDSSKVPDAILKLAIIFVQQDKPEQAKPLFQRLSREFPGTSSARLAERRLKDL